MATFIDSATGGTYTTGAGGRTISGSAAAGGGINPATGRYESGSSNSPIQNDPLRQQISTMSLQEAKNQADQAFSGLVAPMTLEQIRAREAEAKAGVAQTAAAVYDPNISREKQAGAAQVSTAEGVVGQRQGFNISTAEQAFVADVQNKVLDRVREVENIKANYISQGNLAAADRADQQLQQLNEWNTQMTIAKAEYALKIMSGNREQAQLELQRASQATQAAKEAAQLELANEELKLNAYQTALKTPVGKTFEVNGVEYIGMDNLEGLDPSMISLSTDDKGYETGINKLTGEILWKSKVPTGKTKTAASSVTVNMPSYGSSINKVVGADGKTIVGYVRFDSKSNQVIKQDVNGNTISEFPAGSVIGEPTKDDGGWGL